MKLTCVFLFLLSGSLSAATLTRVDPPCGDKLSKVEYVTYLFEAPPEFDPNNSAQVENVLDGLTIFNQDETPIIIYPGKFRDTLFQRRLDARIRSFRAQGALRFAPVQISVQFGKPTIGKSEFLGKPKGLR